MNNNFDDINKAAYFDNLSGAELISFQVNSVKNTLMYAGRCAPYYSALFSRIGFLPEQFSSLEDLRKIPFTTKSDLQAFNDDFLNVPIGRIAEYVTTSGTLGRPVRFLLTDNDLRRLAYNEARGLAIAGVGKGDVIQITTTLDRRFMAGLAYYLGSRLLEAATIRVGVGAPQLQWETIMDMSPTVLIGVPSFIVKLIEFALHHNIPIGETSVRKIICIGEPVRELTLEWNKVGQYIRSHWEVELFSTYASTEMATAFTECAHGLGGHQLNELIFTEVVDEEGDPVADGEVGELVVTTLQVEAMPLIRFRTGDMVIRYNAPCPCGRHAPRLSPIVGRKGQLIKYKGTSVYPSALQNILDHLPEVETYVIEAVLNDFGEDQLNVLLAIRAEKESVLRHLRELCQAHIRVTPEFHLREVQFINHLRNRPEMRKPVVFIDNRMK